MPTITTDKSIIDDTFVASNGANLSTISGWSTLGANVMTILNNRIISDGATLGFPAGYARASSSPSDNDYAVEVGFWFESTGVSSIFCYPSLNGSNNGYGFGWNAPTGQWRILRLDAGVGTAIANGSATLSTDTIYRVVYRRNGNVHTLYVDDVESTSVTEGTYTFQSNMVLLSVVDVDATQGGHIEYIHSGDFLEIPDELTNYEFIHSFIF